MLTYLLKNENISSNSRVSKRDVNETQILLVGCRCDQVVSFSICSVIYGGGSGGGTQSASIINVELVAAAVVLVIVVVIVVVYFVAWYVTDS